MKNIKSFQDFNEEINWKGIALGTALGAATIGSNIEPNDEVGSEYGGHVCGVSDEDEEDCIDPEKCFPLPHKHIVGKDGKIHNPEADTIGHYPANENSDVKNYMFFSNLENIKKMIDDLSTMDKKNIDTLLSEHDWASDHMSVATENLEHLYNFFSGMK